MPGGRLLTMRMDGMLFCMDRSFVESDWQSTVSTWTVAKPTNQHNGWPTPIAILILVVIFIILDDIHIDLLVVLRKMVL